MNRITPDHLSRSAIVYVRQSTMHQVRNNAESRNWQYDLKVRAGQLGWPEATVIDDDLGRSGSGTERAGFDRMLAAVCRNEVGMILAVDASRLARNGREWHTLIEFCGLVGCLLADENTVYDPRLPTDRMLLGMHGAMSELEASNIRKRSEEGARRKAERGELFLFVAAGYRRVGKDGIEMDPDLRVREALSLVFRKFRELQSVRQLHLWLRQEGIELPSALPGHERLRWSLPGYTRVHSILTNPVYAGAYAFGRRSSRISIRDGRKHVSRGHSLARDDWQVLKRDNHEGYIAWDEFEANQRVISNNASKFFPSGARGAVRGGEALLAGLMRCGHCGQRIQVAYSGTRSNVLRYHCRSSHLNHGERKCISFGGRLADEAIGGEIVRVLQPIGMEASLLAIEDSGRETSETVRQTELALERARYEADRAWRQYDSVDVENRQVAGELERRWNERLITVSEIEATLARLRIREESCEMSAQEREDCLALGADLERAWTDEKVTPEIRKRILRAALVEVVASVQGPRVRLLLHWRGGDHTEINIRRNKSGQHRYSSDAETEEIISALARLMPDSRIAALLNRLGRKTAKGNSWREPNVRSFRSYRDIPVYREGERQERDELTLPEAAEALGVGRSVIRRLIKERALPARQVCKGAPWVISGADLSSVDVGKRSCPEQPSLFESVVDPANDPLSSNLAN